MRGADCEPTIDRIKSYVFGYIILKAYFDSHVDISCRTLDTGVWSSGKRPWLEKQRLGVTTHRWNMRYGTGDRR